MTRPQIGVFLPTFSGAQRRRGDEIAEFAQRAEALGFGSLWATDHLLHGSLFYSMAWLEPLVALTYAACATSRIRLGTSILVMGVREPVVLAKQLSTLQALSGDRFVLGAGTGWDAREFEAVGTEKRFRGQRTDEALSIVRGLLAGESITFAGKHFRLEDVEIAPAAAEAFEVWIGGGRQLPDPNSPERPLMARNVLDRIGRADGWIARPTSTPSQITEDLEEISEHLEANGRDPASLTIAHENFLHYVPTDDPQVASSEQTRAFTQVMGQRRPFAYFEQVYLTGTRDEVAKRIQDRVDAGVQHLMLHTLTPSIDQLELWAEDLLPRIRWESG